jgi:hypothetical protein
MAVWLKVTFFWNVTRSNIPEECSLQHESVLHIKIISVRNGEHSLPTLECAVSLCCTSGKKVLYLTNHTEHINTVSGQNSEFLTVKCINH